MDEVVHSENSTDVSRVEAEEDSTKCRKSAHQVGLPCYGGFDTAYIGRASKCNTAAHFKSFGEVDK